MGEPGKTTKSKHHGDCGKKNFNGLETFEKSRLRVDGHLVRPVGGSDRERGGVNKSKRLLQVALYTCS